MASPFHGSFDTPADIVLELARGFRWQDFIPQKLYLVCRTWNTIFIAKFLAFRPDRCRVFHIVHNSIMPGWVPNNSIFMIPIKSKYEPHLFTIIDDQMGVTAVLPQHTWKMPYFNDTTSAHELPSVRYFAGFRADGSDRFPAGRTEITDLGTRGAIIHIHSSSKFYVGDRLATREFADTYILECKYPNGRIIYVATSDRDLDIQPPSRIKVWWYDGLPSWWNFDWQRKFPLLTLDNFLIATSDIYDWIMLNSSHEFDIHVLDD